jgi:hypothetical protein
MGYCELGEEKERYKPAFFLDGLQIESGVLFLFPISFVMEPFVFFFLFLSLRSVLTEGYHVLLAVHKSLSCSSREYTYPWDCDLFYLQSI